MCIITQQYESKLEELIELRNQAEQIEDYHTCNKLSCEIWNLREYVSLHKKLDTMIIDSLALNYKVCN